jgi:tetratricopeptide (TPR) repeat protein
MSRREYDIPFDRTLVRVGGSVQRVLWESAEASALFRELLREPFERRMELIRNEPRFRLVKLCQRLEAESRDAWATDPARAVELAELAVEIAERLDARVYGDSLTEDTRALAWAYFGNALRIASDLEGAELALDRAEAHYHLFEGDLLTEGEILGFQASLRNSQGRFGEAVRLLQRALRIYRELGDRHQEGRTLILEGMVLGDSGSYREAIRLLRRGLARIDPAAEPQLLVAARHNLIWFLNDLGRHREAQAALERSRPLYLELGSRMHLVRLRWLEGRIALNLGRLEEAERALRLTRDTFLEQGIAFDAALASLDLAMVHARQGDAAEVKRIAAAIVPVFQACQVHPEALAAALLFREVAEAETVTAGFLDRMAGYLQRARRNPELRFEG